VNHAVRGSLAGCAVESRLPQRSLIVAGFADSMINVFNKPNYVGYLQKGGFINDWYQEGRISQLGLHVTF